MAPECIGETSADMDAREALEEFGIDVAKVEDLAGATTNTNHLVTTSAGGRLVLRRCDRNPDAERLGFQLSLQDHLHGAGYPVPAVLRTPGGHALVGGAWTLSPFVDGSHYDFD